MQVKVRRHWKSWQVGSVDLDSLPGLHWSRVSGGISIMAPQPFIHGYVWCNEIQGEIAHSCLHGEGPHNIKICIVKKDNSSDVYKALLRIAGEKPRKPATP